VTVTEVCSFLKKRTKKLLSIALGAVPVAVLTAPPGCANPQIPILVYHRFDAVKPGPTTMMTSVFEQQLDWLATHHYQITPLRTVVDSLRGNAPPIAGQPVAITADDGHVSVYTNLFPIIRRRHIPVTLFIYPSAISNASYALTWDQLAEMLKSGLVDVQSHTYWHPNFRQERAHRTADDYRRFVDIQLQRSKDVVQRRLGVSIDMLAWPYGIVDTTLEEAATRAGYKYAYAFAGGWAHEGMDPLAIPRIPVSGFVGIAAFPALFPFATARKSGS